MTRIDLEDLLWRLADSPSDRPSEPTEDGGEGDTGEMELPDAVLIAYREGRLAEARRRQVEDRLATSPAARRRLVELADLPAPAGFVALRRRVLEGRTREDSAAPRSDSPRSDSPWRDPLWRRRAGWLAAAALVVTFLGLGLMLSTPDLPPLPEIQASIDGPAEVRGGQGEPAGSDSTTATPDTPVTVGIHVDPARAGVAVALYHHDTEAGALRKLAVAATWPDRGTARFRALARELVGERPGVHRLYAVAAWEDHLPPPRRLAAREDPLQALTGPFTDVSPLTLEIVRDLPPDSPGAIRSPSDL